MIGNNLMVALSFQSKLPYGLDSIRRTQEKKKKNANQNEMKIINIFFVKRKMILYNVKFYIKKKKMFGDKKLLGDTGSTTVHRCSCLACYP